MAHAARQADADAESRRTQSELRTALRDVRETLLTKPVSPRVETPRDINLHYCRYVAETVHDRVDADDVAMVEDGGRGYVHTWLAYDGRHYDAECLEGVTDHRNLPFFERHPEAAIRVEPDSTDSARLRHRGEGPLYPDLVGSDSTADREDIDWGRYRTAVGTGVLIGLALIAIGVIGEWTLHRHLIRAPASLEGVFIDLERLGGVVVLVSPLAFYLLLGDHRPYPE